MKKSLFFLLAILCSLNSIAQVRYVTPTGAGDFSGSSWANAGNDLQTIINASTSGDEIWIAAGVYKPNRIEHDFGTLFAPVRYVAFKLKDGVKLYGGFTGTETLLSQRNWTTNKTIFSGDIDNNDVVAGGITTSVVGSNCIHVIISAGIGSNSVVDGFYITGGYTANGFNITINGFLMDSKLGSGISNNSASPVINNCTFIGNEGDGTGGGICNNNSSPVISNCIFTNNLVFLSGTGISNNSSSPSITNCTFTSNIAGTLGAGIYNGGSSPTITNCTFTNNTSNSAGGAIFNTSFQSSPVITKCSFTGNSSYFGGAVELFNSASATLKNCSFINNNSDNDGGGIYCSVTSGTINIMNCIFYNNHANITTGSGGGICAINGTNNNSVVSCSFYGNTASNGTAINSTGGILKVYNSVVWGTTTGGSFDFKNSVAEGLAGGSNGNLDGTVITATQLFTNAAGGNLTLNTTSPAINAGSNALYTTAGGNLVSDKDVANNARLVNSTIDIGGYEFDISLLPLHFGNVQAIQDNDNAIISWQTYSEVNTSHFDIEYSADGKTFNTINSVPAANTTAQHNYNYTDISPLGSVLFYRIKQVDITGDFSYSAVVKVKMNKINIITIYPNPASDLLIVRNNRPQETAMIQIIALDGKILMQQKSSANIQFTIKVLSPGIYLLHNIKKDGRIESMSFLKQ